MGTGLFRNRPQDIEDKDYRQTNNHRRQPAMFRDVFPKSFLAMAWKDSKSQNRVRHGYEKIKCTWLQRSGILTTDACYDPRIIRRILVNRKSARQT
jgi:hypothetical protein